MVERATATRGTRTVAKTVAATRQEKNIPREHHFGPLSLKVMVAVRRLRLLDTYVTDAPA